MVRDDIKNLIKKAIKQAQKEKRLSDFEIGEIHIEHPQSSGQTQGLLLHGDYSTNIAMKIGIATFRSRSKNRALKCATPAATLSSVGIAKVIGDKLKVISGRLFEKVEVAGPGFINFTLSEKYLQKQVGEILKEGEIATFRSRSDRRLKSATPERYSKVLVEFISANPTGPLHLGHGRGAFAGDTLANVLEAAGYNVKREYYINDAKKSGQIKELGRTVLGKGTAYLTENLKSQISNLKTKSQISKLKEGEAGYLLAQEVHKDIRDFIQDKLKIKFDRWVSEEKLYQEGKVNKIEKMLQEKNLVYEKEGALWLKTSRFGDDKDRVLIKQGGHPTYLLPDIAYHKDKFDRGFDKVIDVWGADHLGHTKPLKIGLKILGHNRQKLEILISQMVRLKKEGKAYKMSKRKGEVIDLEWLVDEVGLDVTRFLYLMKSLDTQMEFDLDLAKERSEKNPVFYVQYASARIHGILAKLKSQISNLKTKSQKSNLLTHQAELDLIRQLIRFPEVVEDTAQDYQVQRLPHYGVEIASCFHYFYKCCRVRMEDKDLMKARLALVLATKMVLENVLRLMGIHAPKRM